MRSLAGAGDVLAAHGPALPQPDQLCGPFAAWAALHAVVVAPPTVTDLALASGTAIWPHDVSEWRPEGAPLDRTGWERLPAAATIDDSGTDAAGLAAGMATLCPDVTVVPARGPGDATGLLRAVLDLDRPVGVVANLRTGPVSPGATWDVGHFVVLWGMRDEQVAVADSYVELGAPDQPPGCRLVAGAALDEACAQRGLLLLVAPHDADAARAVVADAGLRRRAVGHLTRCSDRRRSRAGARPPGVRPGASDPRRPPGRCDRPTSLVRALAVDASGVAPPCCCRRGGWSRRP